MTSENPTLLPFPQQLRRKTGKFFLHSKDHIKIDCPNPQDYLFSIKQIKESIRKHRQLTWHLTASQSIPDERVALRLTVNPQIINHPQGYQLIVTSDNITLISADQAGMFYGVQTLKQIITQAQDGCLPCFEIDDWPDFPVRGVMLDISRDKVYKMEVLFLLVDELSSWKINQLQLYTEHSFAYLGHEIVWRDASPMTSEDILCLDRFCQERYIELVPNQNSFGHMSRWLKHPEYQHLAETTKPVQTPWGHIQKEPFSICPVLPESIQFITELYDQLLPNFSSNLFNVGCDETFDIGEGKSKPAVQSKGKGLVYLDYLISLNNEVVQRGFKTQFWGDVILQHPDLLPQLPKDMITLDWGYEGDHPFEVETKIFQEADVPYYVCPGTSSWNSIGGRIDNMLVNSRSAAVHGLKNGAIGYLITDWGDNGHWQQLPISYPGLALGAAFSWCIHKNQDQDMATLLNKVVFRDKSQTIGKILVDIGNEYKSWGLLIPNSSPLFWLLQEPASDLKRFALDDISPIIQSLKRLDIILSDEIPILALDRPDATLINNEIRLTIRLMQHACKRAALIFGNDFEIEAHKMLREIESLIADFKLIWLQRNRIGGLTDSLAHFDTLLCEYAKADG